MERLFSFPLDVIVLFHYDIPGTNNGSGDCVGKVLRTHGLSLVGSPGAAPSTPRSFCCRPGFLFGCRDFIVLGYPMRWIFYPIDNICQLTILDRANDDPEYKPLTKRLTPRFFVVYRPLAERFFILCGAGNDPEEVLRVIEGRRGVTTSSSPRVFLRNPILGSVLDGTRNGIPESLRHARIFDAHIMRMQRIDIRMPRMDICSIRSSFVDSH